MLAWTLGLVGVYMGLRHPPVFFSGPEGTTAYVDPSGWSLAFPATWHAQSFSEKEDGGPYTLEKRGVILSNIHHHFEWEQAENISWTPWFEMDGLPSTAVAVQVMYGSGGGFGIFCKHDTPLPLSLKNAKAVEYTPPGPGAPNLHQRTLRFIYRGLPYHGVTLWLGPDASKADLAILEQIVGSISYEPVGDPKYGQEDCLRLG